ncbi:MAG: RNA methyltransferase [Phycisphaerales bacterium]|nr:RNA methyltransferase [Phycisphaerales bacterium]
MGAHSWITIDDPQDPRIDLYRDLKDADLRKRGGFFMAEGELVVQRALALFQAGELDMHSVLVNAARLQAMNEALAPLPERGVPVYVGAQDILDRITGFHVHRGCLAVGKCPARATLDQVLPTPTLTPTLTPTPTPTAARSLIVVCEALRHVDNLGVIFRNAAAFGADAVILDPQSCDPLYRRTLRVSIGHSLTMPWTRLSPWPAALSQLTARGYTLVAMAITDSATPIHEFAWPERTALLLGTEGPGLSWRTLDLCSAVVMAPMAPAVDSLNVGTASGIALYAARYGLNAGD